MSLSPRVYELERRLGLVERKLDALAQRLAAVEQSLAQVWGLPLGQGTGGGSITFWCQGTFSAASGAWPTITPQTDTLDVYRDVGGTLTLETSGATVRWFYKDASGSNKLIPLIPNGDGSYDAVAASCSPV